MQNLIRRTLQNLRKAIQGKCNSSASVARDETMLVNSGLRYSIDRFSVFQGVLHIAGWVFIPEKTITKIVLEAGNQSIDLTSFGLSSPDIAIQFGPTANSVRFSEICSVSAMSMVDVADARLVLHTEQDTYTITALGYPRASESGHALYGEFFKRIASRQVGSLLEVGARARSGITRRELVPKGWEYLGLDIMTGENVDLVGDAHELSALFKTKRFQAIMAFSVLEHLLMPWKFVVELNQILEMGAIGIFTTHQCWPLHDSPWDFWRFSDKAWAGLLNPATGFEILDAQMGERAFIVANRFHSSVAFADAHAGYLMSSVLFRKIGETSLRWPVELRSITSTLYPPTPIA